MLSDTFRDMYICKYVQVPIRFAWTGVHYTIQDKLAANPEATFFSSESKHEFR